MATLQDYRNERLRKLQELKDLGVPTYPAKSHRTHHAGDITARFTELEGQSVTVAGRIVGIRKFGKLAFIVLKDFSGQIQLFLREGEVQALDGANGVLGMKELVLLDTGDFIEATGPIIKTQTGEISIGVTTLRLLTKSLRPMPTELTNKEERMRRRYVDMNVNMTVRDRFVRRSKFWQSTRQFLDDHDFVEVNIPVLEHTTGGADANPFVTHMDALDQDFYLRISHELPLKRLLGAGFEKVYDLGPRFRNENYSDEHLPEHVAMEWYWAYANWQDGMRFTQAMIRHVADATWRRRQFTLMNGHDIDLGNDGEDWPRLSFVDLIKERYGLDVFTCTLEEAVAELQKIGGEVEKIDNRSRVIDKLWKKIRVDLPGPAFLIDIPTFLQPLAKLQPDDNRLTQQFNLILGGTEACKAYSELNDPIDQLNRFIEQQQMRDAGDDEAMMLDIDFVEMLEYGMPPACGYGHSERLFWMLEGVTAREGVPFPQLRSEVDEITKAIYPDARLEIEAAEHEIERRDTDELPLSAAHEGTKKLYLDDFSLLECGATIVELEQTSENGYRIVLDQTCFYPTGGGQACDLGEISWDNGKLILAEVTKDHDGIVYHGGTLEGERPVAGTNVHCRVDVKRRLLNSRLHCAGHLIDYAIRKLGKNWKPGKGAHYPHMSFVEYEGEYDAAEADTLKQAIEGILNEYITKGGPTNNAHVPRDEARQHSDYIPEAILQKYQEVHVVTYPDNFTICCGGTHVTDVAQVGHVQITRIKKKDGQVRVSYTISD